MILRKVNIAIHKNFNIQMTDCLTISGIASDIYINHFYDSDTKPIPYINNRALFDDIKSAYYGGMTEVYRPTNDQNEVLYYYDVNSLYPYVALNPMPGLECKYFDNFKNSTRLTSDMFGFFYCDIKTPDNIYIGLLPVRKQNSGLLFPKGN